MNNYGAPHKTSISSKILRDHHANLCKVRVKTKGGSVIEAELLHQPEAIISVRGKDRFVVMDIVRYHHLREYELEAALTETQADLVAGRFVKESAQAHPARLNASE